MVTFISITIFISTLLFAYLMFCYLFRKRLTRERFAFRVILYLFSISTLIITSLFSGPSAQSLVFNSILKLFGSDAVVGEVNFSDKILILIVYSIFAFVGVFLFRHWGGNVSTREASNVRQGYAPSLFRDFVAAIEEQKGLIELEVDDGSFAPGVVAPVNLKNIEAWHVKVSRYLPLISNQYKIDAVNDWYSEEEILHGSYGKEKYDCFVNCRQSEPSHESIDSLIAFAESHSQSGYRAMIAISGDGQGRVVKAASGDEIKIRYENEFLSKIVDFKEYKNFIIRTYEEERIASDFPYSLSDLYVPSGSTRFDRDGHKTEIENTEFELKNWVSEDSLRQIAVLGEYGQGKSVIALKLTYELLKNYPDCPRIPILITLRGRTPRSNSKYQMLAEWSVRYAIDPEALLLLHDLGRLVLIFDGFDEMDLVGDASLRLLHFASIWSFCDHKNAKLIITGRPNFFLDESEVNSALNIRDAGQETPYTQVYHLLPFSTSQIEQTLHNFPQETRSQIMALATDKSISSSFFELISRPSTLFLAAAIWGEKGSSDVSGSISSAEVIRNFINHANDRQQSKVGRDFLSVVERDYFTLGIAMEMFRSSLFTNSISAHQFREAVADLLKVYPSELSDYDAADDAGRLPLKNRIADWSRLVDTVIKDVQTCGILVNDYASIGQLRFAHKSFHEYHLARISLFKFRVFEKAYDEAIEPILSLELDNSGIFGAFRNIEVRKFAAQLLVAQLQKETRLSPEKYELEVFFKTHKIRINRCRTIAKFIGSKVFFMQIPGIYASLLLPGRNLELMPLLREFYRELGTPDSDFENITRFSLFKRLDTYSVENQSGDEGGQN